GDVRGAATGLPHAAQLQPSRSPRAWRLALFFGIATGAYTLVLAWLPPYYMRLGWSPTAAGSLLGGVTLAEVVAGLAVSATIDRLPDRRPALYAAIAALLAGLLVMLAAPLTLALPAALLLGAGIGALFPLSLIVTVDHAPTPADAAALTGFVQGIGYLIAALFPFAAGVVREHLADLSPAWVAMACLCVVLFALAAGFAPQVARRVARA
ncbi:MFS transporter, partial [Burkholderia vietnamiensis]